MSSGGGGSAEPEGGGGQKNVFGESAPAEVSLNLTALMDILSNLLFFLLASFGATIVMAINVTVPVQSPDKSDVADTKQSVTVNVKLTKAGFDIAATGTAQTDAELSPLKKSIGLSSEKKDQPDYAAFTEHLLAIKDKFPKSDTIILTPEGVPYEMIIRTMDAAREKSVVAGGERRNVKLFPTVVVSTVVK